MSSLPTPSRLSLAPSRQASQDGPSSPPPLVALALSLKPFATKETRRDLTVAKRTYEGAWNGLERCAVLPQSCRRLGERAAAVLLGVNGALEALEQQEQGQKQVKGYEFDGSKAGSSTKIKVQSTLTDLQAFATDFSSNKDRQQLLVHGIEPTLRLISSLNTSLASAVALYSLSLDTSRWAEENALDLGMDELALPRLFQHAIAPRGPTYDAFVKARPPPTGDTSKRRDEFIEWCFEQQPLLRPDPESPLSPRRKWTAPPSPGRGPSSPSLHLEAHRRGLAASPSPPGVHQRRRASEGPTNAPSADMRRTASTSSSASALGVGLAPGGSAMLVRASAPETATTPTMPPIASTSTPLPTATLSETATNEVIEDEELMEGISRQGRRPSDDPSFASTEMSPSSSVDSRMFSTAQAAVMEKVNVAAVPEEATVAVAEEREREAKPEAEKLEAAVAKQEPTPMPAAEPSTSEVESASIATTSSSSVVASSSNEPTPIADAAPANPQPAPASAVEAPKAPTVEVAAPPIEESPPILETPLQLEPLPDFSVDLSALNDPLPALPEKPTEATAPPSSPLPTIPEDSAPRPPLGVPTLTLRPATPISRPPTPPQKGLRILSLDGGGIRGLSLLLTLKSTLTAAPPCEQFDLITGVGSGGLVAILLGRLRLDIDSSIELYLSIARNAFIGKEPSTRSRWSKLFGGGGSSTTSTGVRDQGLERACSTFLPSTEMADPRLLADVDDSLCKTAVLAYKQQGRGGATPCWFRSYEEDSTSAAEGPVTLRQALRASMASSHFFQPYQTTPSSSTFTQPPSTSLNPADTTLDEARRLFGNEPISHFLSIGVGAPPLSLRISSKGKTRSLNLVRQLEMASRSSGQRFRARTRREGWTEGTYRRVEVSLGGGEDPGLEEWASARPMGEAVGRWCAKEEAGAGVKSWLKGEQAPLARQNSLGKPGGTKERSSLRKSMSLSDFAEARALYLHSDGSTSSLI